jgi:uncharacterized membrane protein YeaQ/YmgE (transglycosylase-associated protein family)
MGHGLFAWIIIGLLAGWLTGKIMKGSGFGFIMDMVVGLIGALIGGFISAHLGLGGVGEHGIVVSVCIAVIGAVILTFILRLISGNRSTNLELQVVRLYCPGPISSRSKPRRISCPAEAPPLQRVPAVPPA